MAYRHAESTRLAPEMPPQERTRTLDATLTGGLGWVGMDPESHSRILAHPAPARAPDTWHTLLAPARAGLNCQGIQAPRDEAPGLLASVAHPLGAQHSPDLLHVQPALSTAVSAPMAANQRAAAQALAQVEETRHRVHEPLGNAATERHRRGASCPPQAAARLQQGAQDGEAARHEHQRLAGQREQGAQSMRAIGHADPWVDLARGGRRNGPLLAGDIPQHMDTSRPIAHQEGLSAPWLDRIAQAARVGPTLHATIAFVSG